jgi:hypothetical protein
MSEKMQYSESGRLAASIRSGQRSIPTKFWVQLAIAVGTVIADCPPREPGRALISASGSYLG